MARNRIPLRFRTGARIRDAKAKAAKVHANRAGSGCPFRPGSVFVPAPAGRAYRPWHNAAGAVLSAIPGAITRTPRHVEIQNFGQVWPRPSDHARRGPARTSSAIASRRGPVTSRRLAHRACRLCAWTLSQVQSSHRLRPPVRSAMRELLGRLPSGHRCRHPPRLAPLLRTRIPAHSSQPLTPR